MQQELEQKLTQSDPLTFTDAEVTWLLAHVGDLDGHVRDEVTFTLLARGRLASGFTLAQKAQINRTVVAAKPILQGIDQPQNDQVFLRSFAALLGSLILRADAETPFLSRDDRGLWFQWALEYLYREHDWRGYVQGRGWAHALAEGRVAAFLPAWPPGIASAPGIGWFKRCIFWRQPCAMLVSR